MSARRNPTGFVAVCQCGITVGAMDYERTGWKEAGRLLGHWLSHGCTITPRFDHRWTERIEVCQCDVPATTPEGLQP